MPALVCTANSPEENGGPDLIAVDIDPQYAAKLSHYRAAFNALPDNPWSLEYGCGARMRAYRYVELETDGGDGNAAADEGWCLLDGGLPEDELFRTEANRACVSETGVSFCGLPRHYGFEFGTTELTWDEVATIAREQPLPFKTVRLVPEEVFDHGVEDETGKVG